MDLTKLDTLQVRYRPHTWETIIGQEHIVSILKGIVKNQTFDFTRSYVFSASPGCGKTTTARVFANAIICDCEDTSKRPCLQCEACRKFEKGIYPDYLELDAGNYNKVEDIKSLIEIAKIYPVYSRKSRVILLDEAHRLSNAAWDSMLKLLEDGTTKTIFMFATTEGDKIRKAIHSRSLSFQMKPLGVSEIKNELLRVCKLEGIEYDIPSIDGIAYSNRGKMRDALKTLDMYYRANGNALNISIETAESKFCKIFRYVVTSKMSEAIEVLDSMVVSGLDLSQALCNTLSAIYTFPTISVVGIDEALLSSTKTLVGGDIKRLVSLYMEYKPITYEQIKLWLYIIADSGVAKTITEHTTKRQLFKKREVEKKDADDYDEF